jgi:hypothetical protein
MRQYRRRRRRNRFLVRVELYAAEIDALVRLGFLDPKDRDDLSTIQQAADAFLSDALVTS